MGPLFTQAAVPAYHDNLLLVRMKPVPAPAFASTLATRAAAIHESQGLQALTYYERAGLLKRVTPISSGRPAFSGHTISAAGLPSGILGETARALGMRAASVLTATGEVPELSAGTDTTSLIELEKGESVRDLQLALASDANVASVSRVPIRYLVATRRPSAKAARKGGKIAKAAPPTSSMWNLRAVRWAEARSMKGFKEPLSVKVAVLDTGIDLEHPDLTIQKKNYVYKHPDLPGASSPQDLIGHGTHVAGTIAAAIDNALGVNGICQCELFAWKIFDDEPDLIELPGGRAEYAYFVDPVMYLRALLDCLDKGIDVVNLSIGGGGKPDPTEADAFADLMAGGTTVVAAMGNERMYGSPTSYPAAIPGVIAVGATGITDRVTNFSNRGNHITLCAPGDAIWSTLPTYAGQMGWEAVRGPDGEWQQGKPDRRETDYDAWPGTSMASPHVAAAAALYLGNSSGKRSPQQVRQALIDSADKVGGMGGNAFHPDYGYGRLNLEALISKA